MDALVNWEFWAGVLLAGLCALGVLLRWIMLGDGRSALPHPSINPPLHFQQSPLTHAHPEAAVALRASPAPHSSVQKEQLASPAA